MFYWIPDDQLGKFQEAVKTILQAYKGASFASDMLIAVGKSFSFLRDKHFVDSFEANVRNEQEHSLIWRLHVLAWAARHALHVPGDFVECGVLRGFSSAVLCRFLDFEKVPKAFYLYDTFSGLPEETSTLQERQNWNYEKDPALVVRVRESFAPFPNVRVIQGVVPHSFREAAPDRISYLHIDMNSTQAEILALEHLFDRVSPGGMIVLDDFGWVCNRDQAAAEIGFMSERGYAILELPTGQGLVVKR